MVMKHKAKKATIHEQAMQKLRTSRGPRPAEIILFPWLPRNLSETY